MKVVMLGVAFALSMILVVKEFDGEYSLVLAAAAAALSLWNIFILVRKGKD